MRSSDVKLSETMRRALHIGLFIGTLIGCCAFGEPSVDVTNVGGHAFAPGVPAG